MNSPNLELAVKRLYDVTKTPVSTSFNYPEAIIDDLLGFLNLSEEELKVQKKLVLFLLRLVDVPEDLKGAGHAAHFMPPLLAAFSRAAKLSSHEKGAVNEMITNWFRCLEDAPVNHKYFRDVDGNESQLYRFHLEASDLKLPRHYSDIVTRSESLEPSPLYCRYSPQVHVRIREFITRASIEKEDPRQKIYEHICSARMFFNFMHRSIKYTVEHPPKIPEFYIDSFVEEYDYRVSRRISRARSKAGDIHPDLSKRASEYKSLFCTLMEKDYTATDREYGRGMLVELAHEVDDYEVAEGIEDTIQCYGKGADKEFPDGLRVVTNYVYYDESEEDRQLYGIEAPFEEEMILGSKNDKDRPVRRPPKIRRSWQEFINMRKFYFFWDSSFMNLYHYSRLYEAIDKNFYEKSQKADNVICAFIMMLIHTGITPLYLLDTKIKAKGADTSPILPVIEKEGQYYKLIIDPPFIRKFSGAKGCLPIRHQVELNIPSFLRPYIENICYSGKAFLFSLLDEQKREIRLDLTMVENFLKKNIKKPFGLSISYKLIKNSFFALYSARYGMDPIVACYVSKSHHGIFNAALHYIFLPREHFISEYRETSKRVHEAIKENLRIMKVPDRLSTTVPRKTTTVSRKYGEEIGYGSPQIPTKFTWQRFFDKLKKAVRSCPIERLYQRHNLYSIYLYFVLMLSTSFRPSNNPDIRWDSYNDKLGYLVLFEKLSPKYVEERLVPIVEQTGKLINNLRSSFSKFKELVAGYHAPDFDPEGPDKLFFFLDKDYNCVDFTLKGIKDILAEAYISFHLPLNTPRHNVRSTFYWESIYHEAAAMLMGHQTSGKEWLAAFSSADYSEVEDLFRDLISKMLADLRVEPIPYLPRLG